jgi:quinol monooxygenase YgiN
MPRNDITVLVHLRLLPESVEAGMSDLLNFARTVRQREPACLALEVTQDIDDPTRVTMIEKWADLKAYEGPHLKTPHMKAFIEESSKHFDGPADVYFLRGTVIERNDSARTEPYGR